MARYALLWNPLGSGEVLPPQVYEAGWEITEVGQLEAARAALDERPTLVGIARLHGPDLWACRALEELILHSAIPEWVALVGSQYLTSQPFCRLAASSLFDFHTLPVHPPRLLHALGHAHGLAVLRQGYRSRAQRLDLPAAGAMIGNSASMRALLRQIRKVAHVSAPVLITGASGVGKELTARAIHEQSNRAGGAFAVVNCATLPASLIAAELFGYEKGAFTGAHQRKIGRLEAAAGGTLFLDEIGDLPLDQQVSLLRFLQDGTVDRVGGTRSIPVDARVIAATNRELERAVQEGRFREDLYYRLNVLRLHVPPLRERLEDVETLAVAQFARFAAERGAQVRGFSDQALQCMVEHSWPGNVRELINRVRRAMVMAEGRLITPADLGLERRARRRQRGSLREARIRADVDAIQAALRVCRHNLSMASRELGVSRVTLYRLMEKYAIPIPGAAAGARRAGDGAALAVADLASGEKQCRTRS